MNLRRGVAPPSPVEIESLLTLKSLSAEVPAQESNLPVEETPAIAISIVSHSHLLSAGLLALLSPYLSLKLIGTYSSETHIGPTLPSPPGHVVLLDSGVGRSAAIAWTRHWHGLIPSAFVLILELANDNALILACIEAGANGYTLQGATAVEVAEAIKDVCSGVAHCSPEVTAHLYARVAALATTVTQLSVSPLTARESEILRYIATGYTNLEIAAQLVIELRTVKQHVHHILGKLKSGTRREAVRFAAEHGWLDRDPRPLNTE
jgi:DNA-binding NarL/FixJ family response regulator